MLLNGPELVPSGMVLLVFTAAPLYRLGCTYVLGRQLQPANTYFVSLISIKRVHEDGQDPCSLSF